MLEQGGKDSNFNSRRLYEGNTYPAGGQTKGRNNVWSGVPAELHTVQTEVFSVCK